jgi:hypothetical protein
VDGRDASYWAGPEVVLCARRLPHLPVLCGVPAFTTKWTTERRYVSCAGCLKEIERRLAGYLTAGR